MKHCIVVTSDSLILSVTHAEDHLEDNITVKIIVVLEYVLAKIVVAPATSFLMRLN